MFSWHYNFWLFAVFCCFRVVGSQITSWHRRKYKCVVWEKGGKSRVHIFWGGLTYFEKKHTSVSSGSSLCLLEMCSFVTTLEKIHPSLAKTYGREIERINLLYFSVHLGQVLLFLETIVAFAVVWLEKFVRFHRLENFPSSQLTYSAHFETEQYKQQTSDGNGGSAGAVKNSVFFNLGSFLASQDALEVMLFTYSITH